MVAAVGRRAPQRQRLALAARSGRSVIGAVKPMACNAHAGYNYSLT